MDLPLCLRRSAVYGDSVMKVYNIRDVEKKALQVHGSLEKISKLESNRVQQEENLKQLKFIYNKAKKRFKQTDFESSISNLLKVSNNFT